VEKEKEKKAGEFLCCNNTAQHYQSFKLLPRDNSSFWLLLLALGGAVCCVGVLAVCFGLWTLLHV
jgi:hypothetical protein